MASDKSASRGRWRATRRFKGIVIVLVTLILLVGGAYAYTYNPFQPASNPFTTIANGMKPLGVTNILLVGNNARNPVTPLDIGTQGGGQADIMILVHIDPKAKEVTLISIPRDLLFAMPNENNPIPKIKTSFFIGATQKPNEAAQMTVAAVEKFTGMPIQYWVVTDFQGFEDAINAVGGVRVDVPGRIYDPLHSQANLYPGWQTLDGAQALAFVRVRQNTVSSAGSNDFVRDDDQAVVLSALKDKLLNKKSDLSHIGPLIQTWTKDVRTNMSYDTLVKVAMAVQGDKMQHMNLAGPKDSMLLADAPAPGLNRQGVITGAYYDVVNPAQVYRILRPYGSTGSWTGYTLPSPVTVTVDVNAPASVAAELRRAGFSVTEIGSGTGSRIIVSYPPGQMTWGMAVGQALGSGDELVQPGTNPSAVVVTAP